MPFGVGAGALRELRLQMDGSERCAELVRRVRDECALRAERAIESRQETIQRLCERSHLARQSRLVDRLETAGHALADGGRKSCERRESPRNADADEKCEQGCHDQQR